MTVALNLFLHALLLGSLGVFIAGVVAGAVTEKDPQERVLRLAALVAGAMVALGAQTAGVSYADFVVRALSGARTASAGAAIIGAIIPALMGVGVAFYLVRTFRRSTRIGQRLLGFLAMLTGVAFAAIYAQATQTKGVILGAAAIPNVAFVTGIILTIVFTWDPDREQGGRTAEFLKQLWTQRGKREPGDAEVSARVAPKSDPFSDR